MTWRSRRVLGVAIAAGLLWGATAMPRTASASSAVPFSDPYAQGSLTLCNRNNQPVTSGSLTTVPFVWSAISSVPAPKGYSLGDLLVYQPIQYVDPSDWSGYQLTDNSIFSSASHPKTQATNADPPLLFADHVYPPHWDNLMELRMYYSAPDKPAWSSTYPTAVIRISGDNWSLVSGGDAQCDLGTATSLESKVLPQTELASPQTLLIGHAPTPGSNAGQAGQADNASNGGPGSKAPNTSLPHKTTTTSTTNAVTNLAAGDPGSHPAKSGISTPLIVLLVALVVGGGLTAGIILWRRRFSPD